jgi:glutathione S-transferase
MALSVEERRSAELSNGAAARRNAKKAKRFTVYGYYRSGPTYKVVLMLALARTEYAYVHVDLQKGEHKTSDFLSRNPFGQVPCLFDGKQPFCQSAAILEHLGHALGKFVAPSAAGRARVREWLYWDFDRLAKPVYRTRAYALGLRKDNAEIAAHFRSEALAALADLEGQMAKSGFLIGARPTIADIDIYGVVRFAPEGGIPLDAYPKLQAWCRRMEKLPGFAPPEVLLPKECCL